METLDPALKQIVDQVLEARDNTSELYIRGGDTKAFYGSPPRGNPLDMRPLHGISSYEPTELVVTARAGTPLAELEAALEEKGQYLPFEPPRFAPGGTVGGMVAAGLSGPPRASVGAVRDFVLGTTLLNGKGEVLTFGGQVMKNVAGYDVSRLMAGSLGVLGVICEVSLKVVPAPTALATLAFEISEADALKQLNTWGGKPLPLNASAWHQGRLYVRLAGAAAAVSAACKTLGGDTIDADAAAAWWASLRDQTYDFFSPNDDELSAGECLWRLSLPSTSAPVALPGTQFIEWGGAQRWWRTSAAGEEIRAVAASAGGHATLYRGAGASGVGVFAPLAEPLMRIHQGLKHAFDPQCIFNPGRMYESL